MINKFKDNLGIFIIASFCVVYFFLSLKIDFNNDVDWLIRVGKLWLNNGEYINDFFETNPPLAFYIYLPAILINHLIAIKLKIAFSLYYILNLSTSLILILKCLKYFNLNKKQQLIILSFIATWFTIIPLYHLGQRDVFSSILVTPHIFYCFIKLKDQEYFKNYQKSLILLMAIIGYMIKPQFIIVWLCLFITKLVINHSFKKSLQQSHGVTLFCAGILYLTLVYIFNPSYYTTALPILLKTYYNSFSPRRLYLILHDPHFVFKGIFIALNALVFGLIINKKNNAFYYALGIIAVGYTLSYFIQGLGFDYHSIPALYGSSLMIFSISICEFNNRIIFIAGLFLSLLITITTVKNSLNYTLNVSKTVKEKVDILNNLPNHARVYILTRELSMYNTLPKSAIYTSAFQSLSLISSAYSKKQQRSFNILKNIIANDFIKKDFNFILISNSKRWSDDFISSILTNPKSKNKWRKYQTFKESKCYKLLRHQSYPKMLGIAKKPR